MSDKGSIQFKLPIQQSPIYKGGLNKATIRRKYGLELEAIVKLSSNENPLPPSPKVVETLQAAVQNLNRYPPMGDDGLREALATYIGRGIQANQFVTGNGGCDVLRMIADGFLNEAVICPPTFPVYELTVKRTGANAVYAPLNDHYEYDIDAILAAITDKTRLIYLCSPNNPTGSYLTDSQLEALMAGLPDHVVVVADEVYYHFNTAPDFANSFNYLDRNLIIVHSFSKVFGLAGLRLGYGIARPELAEYLSRSRLPFHINLMTMLGGESGLGDRDHIEETVSLIVSEREKMASRLAAIEGIQQWPSQANFILFQPPYKADEVAARLQQKGAIVRELSGFYMPGFLRATIGLPEENERFIGDLQRVIAEMAAPV